MNNENKNVITWVHITNYLFVGVFLFYALLVLVNKYFLGGTRGSGNPLPSIVYIIMLVSTGIVGFITLPLHIHENARGCKIEHHALMWSVVLTTCVLIGVVFFNLRYTSMHHSGFSDTDVLVSFLSGLFLINSYFFIISLIVRKKANLFIHKLDYLFGIAMLLVAFSSTWGIVYLLCKVFS